LYNYTTHSFATYCHSAVKYSPFCNRNTNPNIQLQKGARRCCTLRVLGKKFQVSHFCSNSISLGCIHSLKEEIPKEFPWGKVRHARTADSPAVTVVPNVKVKVNGRHSIPYLSPHDLLGYLLYLSFKLQAGAMSNHSNHKTQNICMTRQISNNPEPGIS